MVSEAPPPLNLPSTRINSTPSRGEPTATPAGCSTFDAEEEKVDGFVMTIATPKANTDGTTTLASVEKERC